MKYILQRSTNNGRTWKRMREDAHWYVVSDRNYIGIASKLYNLNATPPAPLPPPRTGNHQYRIKIVLDKKKKGSKAVNKGNKKKNKNK